MNKINVIFDLNVSHELVLDQAEAECGEEWI